ncbi:MAG: hypothetical protein ACM32E_16130 [Gemmatimonadota bacterium]
MIIAGYRRIAGQASRGGEAALLAARLAVGWLMLLHGLRHTTRIARPQMIWALTGFPRKLRAIEVNPALPR